MKQVSVMFSVFFFVFFFGLFPSFQQENFGRAYAQGEGAPVDLNAIKDTLVSELGVLEGKIRDMITDLERVPEGFRNQESIDKLKKALGVLQIAIGRVQIAHNLSALKGIPVLAPSGDEDLVTMQHLRDLEDPHSPLRRLLEERIRKLEERASQRTGAEAQRVRDEIRKIQGILFGLGGGTYIQTSATLETPEGKECGKAIVRALAAIPGKEGAGLAIEMSGSNTALMDPQTAVVMTVDRRTGATERISLTQDPKTGHYGCVVSNPEDKDLVLGATVDGTRVAAALGTSTGSRVVLSGDFAEDLSTTPPSERAALTKDAQATKESRTDAPFKANTNKGGEVAPEEEGKTGLSVPKSVLDEISDEEFIGSVLAASGLEPDAPRTQGDDEDLGISEGETTVPRSAEDAEDVEAFEAILAEKQRRAAEGEGASEEGTPPPTAPQGGAVSTTGETEEEIFGALGEDAPRTPPAGSEGGESGTGQVPSTPQQQPETEEEYHPVTANDITRTRAEDRAWAKGEELRRKLEEEKRKLAELEAEAQRGLEGALSRIATQEEVELNRVGGGDTPRGRRIRENADRARERERKRADSELQRRREEQQGRINHAQGRFDESTQSQNYQRAAEKDELARRIHEAGGLHAYNEQQRRAAAAALSGGDKEKGGEERSQEGRKAKRPTQIQFMASRLTKKPPSETDSTFVVAKGGTAGELEVGMGSKGSPPRSFVQATAVLEEKQTRRRPTLEECVAGLLDPRCKEDQGVIGQ